MIEIIYVDRLVNYMASCVPFRCVLFLTSMLCVILLEPSLPITIVQHSAFGILSYIKFNFTCIISIHKKDYIGNLYNEL